MIQILMKMKMISFFLFFFCKFLVVNVKYFCCRMNSKRECIPSLKWKREFSSSTKLETEEKKNINELKNYPPSIVW